MLEKTLEELYKAVHGLQIVWTGDRGLTFDAVVLATPDKGISVKPLGSPEEVVEATVAMWGPEWKRDIRWGIHPSDPKFCLVTVPAGNPNIRSEIWQILETKRYQTGRDGSLFFVGSPVCPY